MPAFAITDNLNWEVEQRPVFVPNKDGDLVKFPGTAIVRSDNDYPLGMVSEGYETFQNRDLLKLVNPLVEEGLLTITNMGHLNNGRKVFVQAQIQEEFQVVGETYKGFITLLNGHVGNASVAIGPSNVRVWCSNTFAMAYQGLDLKFRHSEGVTGRVLESKAVIEYVNSNMAIYSQNVTQLARSTCSTDNFHTLLETVYKKPVKDMKREFVSKMNKLFYEGAGTEGKTYYDAFNAITDYSSNHSKKHSDSRFNYANFGQGSTFNSRAMEVALEMATV